MTKSPKFKNPPLEEVVCGVRFKQLDLPIQRILEMRKQLMHEYPKVQSAVRLAPNIASIDLTKDVPFPRMWFISEDDSRVVQIQNDHFLFNWRKREPRDDYPRFKAIFEKFEELLAQFEAYCEKEGLDAIEFLSCELSYINNIAKGAGWDEFADLGEIFTNFDIDFSKRDYLKNLSGFGSTFGFTLPEDKGSLTVSFASAQKKEDKTKIIQLQLSAKGLGADKSRDAVMDWFQMAHDHIVWGFCELTVDEAQRKHWGRKP